MRLDGRKQLNLSLVISAISAAAAIAAVVVTYAIHYRDGLPSLILYLQYDCDHEAIEMVLANHGKGVARNVSIAGLEQTFVQEEFRSILRRSFLFRTTNYLAPGVELRTVVAAGNGLRESEEKVCDVVLRYKERGFLFGLHETTCPFTLAYCDVLGTMHVRSDLREIKDSVALIAKSQSKIASKAR